MGAHPGPHLIPTEPIGSIPRPPELLRAIETHGDTAPALDGLYESAVKDTIARFEATGSPVVTDGEQRKYHNFLTYCVHGSPNTAVCLPLAVVHRGADSSARQHPRTPTGPAPDIAAIDLSGVKVLVVDQRIRALHRGFQVHVSKPVEPAELIATVASVAGRTGQGEGQS